MTVLSGSTTLFPEVGTVSVALAAPFANATEAGGAPLKTEPLSVTSTATVSASGATWSRLTVNVAAAPSVTGVAPAAMVATGSAARVTVTR